MNTHRHLNQFDRDRIEALLRRNFKQIEIAKIIGVHKTTISREIARRQRRDEVYTATTAEHKARVARSNSKYQGMKIEQHPNLKQYIIEELKKTDLPMKSQVG